jgi:hypothetical protein
VLLPALMVGQNLQNEAAGARAAKTFEDVEDARNGIEQALKLLDIHEEGGIKAILDAIAGLPGTGNLSRPTRRPPLRAPLERPGCGRHATGGVAAASARSDAR